LNTQFTLRGRGVLLVLSVACSISGGTAAAQISGASGAAGVPSAEISILGAGKGQKVRYGKRVAISGFVTPRTAGTPIRLEHAVGGHGFHSVATSKTRADGSYRFAVKATRSGSYRAVAQGTAAPSASRRVTVVADLAAQSVRHVLGGRAVRVKGRLVPRLRGRTLRLQLRTRRGWKTVDRIRTRSGGRFRAAFRPGHPGIYRLRVRFAGDGTAAAASDRLRRVYVYRPGHASWYGPGLYGNGTACGGALTSGRLGVAHKYLPCGTRVTFRHRGRSVTVPVIDRGPFVAGRDWDLTAATKHRLRFGSTGVVWATE